MASTQSAGLCSCGFGHTDAHQGRKPVPGLNLSSQVGGVSKTIPTALSVGKLGGRSARHCKCKRLITPAIPCSFPRHQFCRRLYL